MLAVAWSRALPCLLWLRYPALFSSPLLPPSGGASVMANEAVEVCRILCVCARVCIYHSWACMHLSFLDSCAYLQPRSKLSHHLEGAPYVLCVCADWFLKRWNQEFKEIQVWECETVWWRPCCVHKWVAPGPYGKRREMADIFSRQEKKGLQVPLRGTGKKVASAAMMRWKTAG